MNDTQIPANSFYYGHNGVTLVMDQFEHTIGESECEATAREIVEQNSGKEDMIKYLKEMLIGIEQIKYKKCQCCCKK